jgi:hypothetical protein
MTPKIVARTSTLRFDIVILPYFPPSAAAAGRWPARRSGLIADIDVAHHVPGIEEGADQRHRDVLVDEVIGCGSMMVSSLDVSSLGRCPLGRFY